MGLGFLIFFVVWVGDFGFPLVFRWGIGRVLGLNLSFDLLIDYVSLSFGGVVFFISRMVFLYSFFYMEGDSLIRRFF